MTRLPDFLGLGAQRAGTTWLDALLRTHPALFLPTRRKELHFFDEHFDRGLEWYADFFAETPPGSQCGEITPRYLFDPAAPARIAELLPQARLLAVLRHPVERAYSQFALTVRDEAYPADFETFLSERDDALARGRYHEQLLRFREHFPREQLLVLVFEQLVANPAAACERIGRFLGVDPFGFATQDPAGQGGATRARNAGGRKRFARSYAALRGLGDWCREHDLDAPVNLAKRLGVARLFGRGEALPALAPKRRAALFEAFQDDVQGLERDFGLDLTPWRADAP